MILVNVTDHIEPFYGINSLPIVPHAHNTGRVRLLCVYAKV